MSLRRPILKSLSIGESQPEIPSFRGGHVHFPPTPEMSATFFADSARAYDRSAIVVSPNVCSLPKRHCPDRTYVLTDGKGEPRLLKSVHPEEIQSEDEDSDDTPCAKYDQGAVQIDYFSIPSSSSTPEMAWSESDDSDEPLSSPSTMDSNCSHLQIPVLEVSVYETRTHGASEPHEHFQGALSFLPHPPPPAVERKRNVSLRDREGQGRPHAISGGESSHALLSRSRRPRRESSFTTDVPPDSGCLGGF